ncbi:Arg81 protein [Martiniozyma asiatica (nom. inval.)]|nr:Arg81 protein [Martiniozyma asiatica]
MSTPKTGKRPIESDAEAESPPPSKQKRTKTFLGCYTCRRRKLGCDLTKPTCLRCKRSGFVCEGYEVKLRWCQPVEFDKYGYQLPSKPSQETEYCQRRSIDFVKYSEATAYKLYDEMDSDLARLHNKHIPDKASPTLIKGHFGVFRGSRLKVKKKKVKKITSKATIRNNNKSQSSSSAATPVATTTAINSATGSSMSVSISASAPVFSGPDTPLQFDKSNVKSITPLSSVKPVLQRKSSSNLVSQSNYHSASNRIKTDSKGENFGNEWLSTELLDAALLTASALNGDMHWLDMFDNSINMNFDSQHTSSTQLHNMQSLTNKTEQKNSIELTGDSVPDNMLHMLFQGRNQNTVTSQNNLNDSSSANRNKNKSNINGSSNINNINNNNNNNNTDSVGNLNEKSKYNNIISATITTTTNTNNKNGKISTVDESSKMYSRSKEKSPSPGLLESVPQVEGQTSLVPTTNQNNKFKESDQPISPDELQIHANKSTRMPKHIMEILHQNPLPKSLAIDKFGIPTTSLNVHPMARYLLNYYIEDVADMMTVIPLAKNPWKFIYFPRALMAIGELAGLGKTSNARNGLLNALLAVSAFNLQSKFERNSDEMKYYVDLGIQLRRQATVYVQKCLEDDILDQKYKDVLVAVLSMVTIDVVWGTMSACKIHLDHCERIIGKKMQHKKKLSSKAIILHRIFSSLKLLQDSTSLDVIQSSEIFLNERNYKNFLTGRKPNREELDEVARHSIRGVFRKDKIKAGSRSNSNFNNPLDEGMTSLVESPSDSFSPNYGYVKKGKYKEKIGDSGKVRIEFIVNSDEDILESHSNQASEIPAFVDITRTSFQPSKNKLDDKVVSSDAIYGLPNSLILLFGEVIPLTRFKKYHSDNKMHIPGFFNELSEQLEYKLLTWKLEWVLTVGDDEMSMNSETDSKKQFISPRHEGIYHHVMSFYHALIIYFYRFIENVNPMYLQEHIEKVLFHLNKIQEILENNMDTSYIIPLFWQGFIAGSEAMTLYLQNGFNKWGQDIAQTGIGTYWNARQIMLEIWRRKNHNVKNSSWVDVLRDWKTNVMLT